MADLYTIMSCIWYDVSLQPALVNRRWVTALMQEPIDRVIGALKDIDYWLITGANGSFKHYLRANYPTMGQFFAPLSRNIVSFQMSHEGLPRLRTAIRFATRANFPDPLGLEEDAWAAWQETCLKPWNEVDVEHEREIISRVFPRRKGMLQLDGFVGRFGPGSSAFMRSPSLEDKYHAFKTDALLNYFGNKVDFRPCDMPRCSDGLSRVSETMFVPKWLDKLRTVSMEPPSLMFYQLGVHECMQRMIRRSRWGRHIDLMNAELNADLAWEGSLTGEFATIDLSSASDTVRLELVRTLFHNSCLREALVCCRSRQTSYNGEIYTPTYYAPMGSGLCFSVECCAFACVIDSIMTHHHDRRAWRVYGDDIVLPTDYAEEAMDRLEQLGFLVNRDKSFYGSSGFRESCGGDYYLGENVRPVYISRFWGGLPRRRSSPSLIESNIDLANRLFQYRYARLRVIESLLQVRPRVLFDGSGENGIFSLAPTNYHAKARWNEGLQRTEYHVGMPIVRREPDNPESEDIRLFEWFREREAGQPCVGESRTSISRVRKPLWGASWRSPTLGWRGDGPQRPGGNTEGVVHH